jgi:glycosyltransferase involved in cell wall biosynthesis
MTIRVLHLLGPLRPSGMERMLVTAAKYFRTENVLNIVVGQGRDHTFSVELRSAGCDVREVDAIGLSAVNARAFRRLVRELEVDVVHIHTEGNYLRTALVARWALGRKGAIVRTIHSVFDAKGLWRVRRLLQAIVADRVLGALIVPSPDVAANERAMLRRPVVIFNWVDDEIFKIQARRLSDKLRPDSLPTALLVGNCSAIKHHELALEALSESTHRVIHLGDERDASPRESAILDSLQRSGRLLERGVQSPHDALRRADYFVMSSRHEGMSVALAEAIVAGIPALVNDVKGLQWARKISGVSMVSDDATSWARAITSWDSFRAHSSSSAPDLSASRGAREYAQVYREVLGPSKIRKGSGAGGSK